jgi:hypothetical protein
MHGMELSQRFYCDVSVPKEPGILYRAGFETL